MLLSSPGSDNRKFKGVPVESRAQRKPGIPNHHGMKSDKLVFSWINLALLMACLLLQLESIECHNSTDNDCWCDKKYHKICPIPLPEGCVSARDYGERLTQDRSCNCGPKHYKICPVPPPTDCDKRARFHYDHPDHVDTFDEDFSDDSLDEIRDKDMLEDIEEARIERGGSRRVLPRDDDDSVSDSSKPYVLHRKIYVSAKEMKKDPVIAPIKLTIPVKFTPDKSLDLPPPKPIFKMRKYTKYETEPETVLVPVETTVIKPVGISKDQLIYDKSESERI